MVLVFLCDSETGSESSFNVSNNYSISVGLSMGATVKNNIHGRLQFDVC